MLAPVVLLTLTLHSTLGEVLVADVRGKPREVRLMAVSAQALLNAQGPRAFLLWDRNCERWLTWDVNRFGLQQQRVSIEQLVRAAAARAAGYVRWDADRLDTALMAATIAGVEGLLMATPGTETLVQELGLERKHDLVGRFDGWSRARMFRWLFDNYRDRCSRKYLLNSTVPGVERWDVSKYVRGGFRLRFEDRTKDDGLGAKLRSLKVICDGRTIASFRVFTDAEKPYLIDADASWPDHERDRIADRTQYFVYEFKVPAGTRQVFVEAFVRNGYMVRIAPLGSEQYVTLPALTTRANWPSFQERTLDVAMALKCLCVDLSAHPDDEDEYAVREAISKWLEAPACWLGWHTERDGEGQYVHEASLRGHFVICSGAPNLSFHRHLRPEKLPRPRGARPPRLDPTKVYVSFILSDGDALWCDYGFQGGHWLHERRGEVPFGWEVQPLLKDLGPDILTYYIENATENDCLVGGFVAGYYYPSAMTPAQLDRYLRFAAPVAREAGFSLCTVLNNRVTPREIAEAFDRHLAGIVSGIQEGYWGMRGEPIVLRHVLWLRSRLPRHPRTKAPQIMEDLMAMADAKPPDEPVFVPCHFPIGDANFATAAWLWDHLPRDRFVIVRPDQLFALARQWYDAHPMIVVPKELVALGNLPIAAPVKVHNTTRRPLTVTVRSEGLVSGKAGARVEPFRDVEVACKWRSKPDRVAATVSWDGSKRVHEIKVRRIDVPAELTAGASAAETVGAYDAREMAHRYGAARPVAGSWAPLAWVASEPAQAESHHIVYGPYVTLPPGRYVVVFRLQLMRAAPGTVAVVDIAGGPEHRPLTERALTASDLAPGRWSTVAVAIEAKRELRHAEFRVQRLGNAELAVDRIYVVRLGAGAE